MANDVSNINALYAIKFLDETLDYSKNQIVQIFLEDLAVGRNEDCTIQYSETWATVSRQHAYLQYQNGVVTVFKSKDSTNAILVNKKKMSGYSKILKHKDILQFSKNGPKIQVLSKRLKGEKSGSQILLISSYITLAISIIIFILSILKK